VWINEPFLAGAFPGIENFHSCLSLWLDQDERVEADDGPIGDAPYKGKCPASLTNPDEN
jgi:hypothetical protein